MKKVPPDLMDRLARKTTTKGVQSDYGETTERLRKKRDKKDFVKYTDTDLEVFTVRLMPGSKARLKTYFAKRGVRLSQGVRQIVQDFMERQGI